MSERRGSALTRIPAEAYQWTAVGGAAASVVLTTLAQGFPDSPLMWTFLIVGGAVLLVGGLAQLRAQRLINAELAEHAAGPAATRTEDGARAPVPGDADRPRPVPHRPSPRLIRAAIAGAAAVAVCAVAVPVVPRVVAAVAGCSEPAELRVLVPDESRPAFAALADAFTARLDRNGCRTAHLTVYSAGWPRVRAAFAAGWPAAALREVGPRPDVWLAESRGQYDRVRAEFASRPGAPAPIAQPEPFAYTPLVLGVPNPQAVALEPRAEGRDLLGVLDAAARMGLDVVRPDPSLSYTGLRITEQLYRGTADGGDRRAVEQRLGAAADRGGYPLGDESALLCRRREQGDDPVSAAVLVTEQALVRYDKGAALGAGCPLPGTPAVRLAAFYPPVGDTPGALPESLDYTAVRWPTGHGGDGYAGKRAAAAEAFTAWLRSPDTARLLVEQGLRPAVDDPAGYGADPLPGARADTAYERGAAPGPSGTGLAARLDTALADYAAARRQTRVLLAVDTSGSMDAPVDAAGRTGLDVAVAAIGAPLTVLGPRDAFGLWTFPGAGADPYTEIMPVERGEDPAARAAEVPGKLAAHGTGGRDSPVYRTVAEGIARLAESAADTLPVLVVFTDGVDTTASPDIAGAVEAAGTGGVRVFIVAVGDASCAGSPLAAVADASAGACLDAEFDTAAGELAGLFALLWGT